MPLPYQSELLESISKRVLSGESLDNLPISAFRSCLANKKGRDELIQYLSILSTHFEIYEISRKLKLYLNQTIRFLNEYSDTKAISDNRIRNIFHSELIRLFRLLHPFFEFQPIESFKADLAKEQEILTLMDELFTKSSSAASEMLYEHSRLTLHNKLACKDDELARSDAISTEIEFLEQNADSRKKNIEQQAHLTAAALRDLAEAMGNYLLKPPSPNINLSLYISRNQPKNNPHDGILSFYNFLRGQRLEPVSTEYAAGEVVAMYWKFADELSLDDEDITQEQREREKQARIENGRKFAAIIIRLCKETFNKHIDLALTLSTLLEKIMETNNPDFFKIITGYNIRPPKNAIEAKVERELQKKFAQQFKYLFGNMFGKDSILNQQLVVSDMRTGGNPSLRFL